MNNILEFELKQLESANFLHLVPSFLLNNFKDDLNDRILVNLVSDLDVLIESIHTNNSLKELTLNDSNHQGNDSTISNDLEHDQLLIEISAKLFDIFNKYLTELNKHLSRIEQLNPKFSKSIDLVDLISYQRSILTEKLHHPHYELLVFLFKKVFDFYQTVSLDFSEHQTNTNFKHLRSNHVLIDNFLNLVNIL